MPRTASASSAKTRPHVAAAATYIRAVLSGKVLACKWVRLACQRHLTDLKRFKAAGSAFRFDPERAQRACQFAELFPHVKGHWAVPQPRDPQAHLIRLEPWQCFWRCMVYGWVERATGLRRFRVAYLEVPRKNGKSILAATDGLFFLAADGEVGAEVYCLSPATPILCGDFQYRPLGSLSIGDAIIAFDESPPKFKGFRRIRWTTITAHQPIALPAFRLLLEDGRQVECSGEHRWFVRPPEGSAYEWRQTSRLGIGWRIRDLGRVWERDESRVGGYLAGVFDGEGWLRSTAPGRRADRNRSGFNIGFSQNAGAILDSVRAGLIARGFHLTSNRHQRHTSSCQTFEVRGLSQCFRLLGEIGPSRLVASARQHFEGMSTNRSRGLRRESDIRIVGIEPLGPTALIAVETGTKTLFAAGLFSHNSGATSEKQAWEVFRPAKQMAEKTGEFLTFYGVQVNASNLVILKNGSRFEPVIAKPGDGASPSLAIADEYHEHLDSTLYDTMITGMGARRQPLMLVITTAGTDTGGPCYGLHQDVERMLTGTTPNDRLLGVIYTIDEEDDWTTEAALRKANPNYGVSVSVEFLKQQQADAVASARHQNVFRTKHLNVWVTARDAWLNMEWWHRQADPTLTPAAFAGVPCYAGADLASHLDIAAVVRVFRRVEEDGEPHYYAFGRYYLPEATVQDPTNRHYQEWATNGHLTMTEGASGDFDRIREDLFADIEVHGLEQLALDQWGAIETAQECERRGITAILVPQTTQHLSDPMKALEAAIKAGRFHHDGNPCLAWQMANVTFREDANENIFPRKERREHKIDGAVALIMAMGRARLAESSGSVYDERGPVIVG